MTRLKGLDLLALGFMTFALFLGAGNMACWSTDEAIFALLITR